VDPSPALSAVHLAILRADPELGHPAGNGSVPAAPTPATSAPASSAPGSAAPGSSAPADPVPARPAPGSSRPADPVPARPRQLIPSRLSRGPATCPPS
jgi:hypothetical protein